jgi:hypothetical protein
LKIKLHQKSPFHNDEGLILILLRNKNFVIVKSFAYPKPEDPFGPRLTMLTFIGGTFMKTSLLALICALGLFATVPSHALVDARIFYGVQAAGPDFSQVYTGASSIPSAVPNLGFGADFIISPPLFNLGFGVRYENVGFKASSSPLEISHSLTRSALILNYRLINTLLFVGPIATYGLSHSGSIKVSSNGSEITNMSIDKASSYSLGLEAGAKLMGIAVGAEAGYQSLKYKELTDTIGTITGSKDLDMSGSYLKILLGFSF